MDEQVRRTAIQAASGSSAPAGSAEATPGHQPVGRGVGGTIIGPRNAVLGRENPQTLLPPRTDHGTLPNHGQPQFPALDHGGQS